MSIRKYRWYLVTLTLVVLLAGVFVYCWISERDKEYKEGTLVQTQYVSEEEFA